MSNSPILASILDRCHETARDSISFLKNHIWDLSSLKKQAVAAPLGEPYGRKLLYQNSLGEIMLMSWKKGEACAPHDHGQSRGYVCFLEGDFIEQAWQWRQQELIAGEIRSIEATSVLEAEPGVIHHMKAQSDGLTLHIYLPAIHAMRVYDLQKKETLIVSDQCGAWVPRDTNLILSRQLWKS